MSWDDRDWLDDECEPEDETPPPPGMPEPVERVLKVGVALELIHMVTGWRPPGPFGR